MWALTTSIMSIVSFYSAFAIPIEKMQREGPDSYFYTRLLYEK